MNTLNYIMAMATGTKILLFVLILLASLALIFLLFRSIVAESRKWAAEKSKEGSFSLEEFELYIANQMMYNKKLLFALFRIDIFQSTALLRNLGEVQYTNAFEQLVERIQTVFGANVKIAHENNDTIYIYHKARLSPEALEGLSSLLLRETQKSILVAGTLKVDFDINMGYVSYPEGGKTYNDLKEHLQLAVVASKRKGINNYYAYDVTLSNKETEEYKTFVEIKNAIDNKEFTLYYQPVVNFQTNEVMGAESLLRWKHREKGVLPPSSFLNIIEHTGDINWVGFWALEQLFKQHQQWQVQYPDTHIMLTINLSPRQLMNPQLPDEVYKLMKKNKIDAKHFCMETTQNALLDSLEVVQTNIQRLADMGFVIAIDNYGSVSTSIEILSDFPISVIKLSKSFWNESKSNELTKGVINMLSTHCEKHGMNLIAEGVEDLNDLEYLRELGIKEGQGYHFAKPGTPADLMNAVILTPWAAQ